MGEGKTALEEKLAPAGKEFKRSIFEFIKSVIITVGVVLIITRVFILNSFVPSGSMIPTLQEGSYMFSLRTDYWLTLPKRGDVIVFQRPNEVAMVKRVVGLPGDVVEILDGVTYINGVELDEPYLREPPKEITFPIYEVPEGCYFCMGDNRNESFDSRYWENPYISIDDILAKAKFTISSAGIEGVE